MNKVITIWAVKLNKLSKVTQFH